MRRVKFKVICIEFRGKRHSAFAQGKYGIDYPKNSIVRAREGTLGVAVFGTRKQAESFRRRRTFLTTIQVRPIGRGKTVKFISNNACEYGLDDFYSTERYFSSAKRLPPSGTIFYPAVEVLE